MKKLPILFFLSIFMHLRAEIIETKDLFDVDKYRDGGTLILYDIDNTLMEPSQTLGSDQWFQHHLDTLMSQHGDFDRALEKALADWMAVQTLSEMKEVQQGTADFIRKQQAEGVLLMGLTTRDYGFSPCTLKQLRSLGIDLSLSAPSEKEAHFHHERVVAFYKGILFSSNTHKGKAIFAYLDSIGLKPQKIVFINDKESNLIPVEEVCKKRNIPFIGLRYGYVDHKVENFNKELAELQIKHFGNLLSDDEALTMLSLSSASDDEG